MSSMFTIQLHQLQFHADHGLFEEEGRTGNEFLVNVSLTVKAPKNVITRIDDTINYGEVHRIIEAIFLERRPLLETLAMEMAEALKQQFPAIKKLSIQISKQHPPIVSFEGSVSVTYVKTYK